MGQPRPLFNLFSVFFKQTSLQFLQQMYVKKCPSSIRCRDSNPQPLECESFPITTRPGLPPINVNLLLNAKHTMALFLIIWTNPGHFFLFSSVSHHNWNTNWKSVDVVLGIQTHGRRMASADGSIHLCMAATYLTLQNLCYCLILPMAVVVKKELTAMKN